MASGKQIIRAALRAIGIDARRTFALRARDGTAHSKLGETAIITELLATQPEVTRFFVDIGAGDGVRRSNVLALLLDGWRGASFEADPESFTALASLYREHAGVALTRTRVTPGSVVPLLEGLGTPERPGFLTLDIDGYDHAVLEAILGRYRPTLACVEINEGVPPPVKFKVDYHPDYAWGHDHFYGVSLSQLHESGVAHGYRLVRVHYNNAFLMDEETCTVPAVDPAEAYRAGYVEKPDRRKIFHWNDDIEDLLDLPPERVVERLQALFSEHSGRYTCRLD